MVTQKVELKLWKVPNFARLEAPGSPAVAIGDLDPDALEQQAARWLDNLFAAVGKPSPFVHHGER